jgi:hypothetical protein
MEQHGDGNEHHQRCSAGHLHLEPPSDAQVGSTPYTVSATGGASGNPVVISIDASSKSVCAITGSAVSFTAPGICVIDANQAAGNGYLAGQAQQSFLVGDPDITFNSTPPSPAQAGGPSYTVSAVGGGSTAPVVFSSATPSACTVSGSVVTFVGSGTCTIDANQAGDATHLPAATATQSFSVANLLAVSVCGNTTATVGSSYSCQITTTGAPIPTLKRSGKLPKGFRFVDNRNGTATLSGTPAAKTGGVYAETIEAVFGTGSTSTVVTEPLTLTIDSAPVFRSKAGLLVHTGSSFAYPITTSYGWPAPAISTSSLPTGVTLTDNGNGTASLAGTPGPGTGGVYTATISATSAGQTTTQTFVLTVYQPPQVTSAAGVTVTRGDAMSPFGVTTSGYPVATLKAVYLPAGLVLTGNVIHGTTEAAAGTYTATIVARSKSGSASQTFTVTVLP